MKHFLLVWAALFSMTLTAQNTYTLPTTGDLLIEDCLGVLYDSGGPDEFYTNDNQANVTLTGLSGDALVLTFTEFDVENFFDDLTIYDGPDTSSPILGVYTGTNLPNNGDPIVLSGLTCTIVFESDFSITATGFAISFECLDFTEPPVAAVAFPALSCTGIVAFSDASTLFPTSWAWDFGDGNTSTQENPVHTYASPGTYDIQLTVCNDNGCDTTSPGQTLTFDPDSFACTNGFDMSYQGFDTTTLCNGVVYDNGGITGDYLEGSNDRFMIAPPGATDVTLTFSSFDLGTISNNHDQLYVLGPNNTLLATYNGNTLPGNGQPINFEVPSLVLFFISDHYNNAAGFEVIWEANGSTNPPTADFATNMTTVPFGTAVQFTDQSTENPGGWQWDFGDGTTSNEQDPSHIYTQSGTFSVSLTVTNCNGSDTSTPLTITVQESPALTYDPESFLVEIDAGTSTSELLNLCNLGLGDLVSSISTLDEGTPQVGYIFEFTTSAEGAGFTWELLDNNFELVAQNSQTYAANTDYTEVITGLQPSGEYYFIVSSAGTSNVLETITLTDIGTGQLVFSGFFEFIPGQLYLFPPPFEGTGTSAGVAWLDIAANTNPLAAGTCEDILVTFDATTLIEGTYEGSIVITTNDPDNPLVTIPVTLIVNGTPVLAISTNDLDFGGIAVGGNASLSFDLENTGTAAATVAGLLGNTPIFTVQSSDELVLEPNQSRTINVVFAPDAIADFSETLTLVNNAGDDVIVNLTGTGLAAPSLTINPTDFIVELISGQDTSLTVDIGNVGEAVLTYEVATSSSNTGFVFNFTTDDWGSEFSWNLLNSSGEVVQSSAGTFYNSNTDYSEILDGLSTSETYTLLLLDSFGDGALPTYSVTDLLGGQIVASGSFLGGLFEQSVPIGSPVNSFSTISPSSGTVQIDASNQLSIAIDATGLPTGVYPLLYDINTNDPLQPTATVTVLLFVIAPVEAAISAPSFVCGNLPVQFTDQSVNVPTSWSWDFGDGTTSTEQNPTHTYLQDGVYTISLEACNSLGCDVVEWVDYVEVELDCYTQNIPAHGNEIVTVCEGILYDSGGPTENYLEGNFGSLTIAPPGATSISITFSEFNYEEHSDFLYVYDGDQNTGTLLGAFTGTSLQGQTLTSSTGVLTIQEYTDHFLNLSGFVATFSCVSNPKPPEPEFSIVSASVCANEPVFFVDESLDFPSSWFWEFGDGGTSNEQNPFHIYNASGTYTVSLTVCNTFGCNTLLQDITIDIDPDCLIENMPNNAQQLIFGCFGTLYDSGGADGNYLNNNNASTTIYSTAGPITLEFIEFDYETFDALVIIDGASLTDPIIGYFNGNELPESITSTGNAITIVEITDFSVAESGFQINYSCDGISRPLQGIVIINDEICDGKRSFSADSEGTLDTWYWDFGDGQTSTEANPEHEFSQHGAYEISLVACQDNVCDTMQTMIYSNKLVPEIGAPDTVALGQEIQLHGLTEAATHWSWDFGNGQTSEENAPFTTYEAAGWHDINVHLINMDVHETCDATHVHPVFVDENLTSVAKINSVTFNVYPNPTTGIVNVRGLEDLTGDYQIRIISSIGQVVKVQPLDATISIAAFPAGMYILEVVNEKEVMGRSRIIKE